MDVSRLYDAVAIRATSNGFDDSCPHDPPITHGKFDPQSNAGKVHYIQTGLNKESRN